MFTSTRARTIGIKNIKIEPWILNWAKGIRNQWVDEETHIVKWIL